MNSAERTVKELLREQASLWYVRDQYGSKVLTMTGKCSFNYQFIIFQLIGILVPIIKNSLLNRFDLFNA